jgi:superfamily I DNA/RNA helicase
LETPQTDDEWEAARSECLTRLLDSLDERKVVVAGPGTGKTHAFGELFRRHGGRNLTLTFIRRLVSDLEETLTGLSEVYTFHGYARKLLHEVRVEGLSPSFKYYPQLPWIYAVDLSSLEREASVEDIYRAFHTLNNANDVIERCIRSGNYYDSAGHDDAVFRVLRHFETHQDAIPVHDHLVVDEYQDFNLLEVAFIERLASRSAVLIAGDDDQALYGFKHAKAQFIRALFSSEEYTAFELPFCFRSTTVVVAGANRLIEQAQAQGLLGERISKEFVAYVPATREASAAYPKIVHAECSVERKDSSYMARYVAQQIAAIPSDDIEDSFRNGEPTALVLGPRYFITRIHEEIEEAFPGAELWLSEGVEPRLLDGYGLLRRNPRSRLGWRIVLYADPRGDQKEILERALLRGEELADLLSGEYGDRHLEQVQVLDQYIRQEHLDDSELAHLIALGVEMREDAGDSTETDEGDGGGPVEAEVTLPKVISTTMIGAKGLQAGHVFVVGFINGHFPKANDGPTDDEVSRFLVALTRTRKQCHLLSARFYAGKWMERSIFVDWLGDLVRTVAVDKAYWRGAAGASD